MSERAVVIGRNSIRFERVLPGPIDRVWAWLVEPDRRAKWLAGGLMPLLSGEPFQLQFRHADLSERNAPVPEQCRAMEHGHSLACRITRCEPPTALAFTWGDGKSDESEVTFELTPHGSDVRLVLTHRRLDAARKSWVAAGWHTHLNLLTDRLNGRDTEPFWPVWSRLEAEYSQKE